MAEVGFEDWVETVHAWVKREPLWQSLAYRKALYLYECVWQDCGVLRSDVRGKAIVEQLIRSSGSISANLEEGHGRGYGRQRNWFWKVAIGSGRESKGWYWRAKSLLPPKTLDRRLDLLDEIIALLITELKRQERYT
ncbi:MAG: four helix bundle protein [Anaerolineae bacterium]